MKKSIWLVVGIVILLSLLFLFGGSMMFGGWGYPGWGMMGNWGYSPFGWFGMGLGMLFMWIIPIGVLALIVFGATALVRNTGNGGQPSALKPCPNCGKGIQADWQNCPHCGTTLK